MSTFYFDIKTDVAVDARIKERVVWYIRPKDNTLIHTLGIFNTYQLDLLSNFIDNLTKLSLPHVPVPKIYTESPELQQKIEKEYKKDKIPPRKQRITKKPSEERNVFLVYDNPYKDLPDSLVRNTSKGLKRTPPKYYKKLNQEVNLFTPQLAESILILRSMGLTSSSPEMIHFDRYDNPIFMGIGRIKKVPSYSIFSVTTLLTEKLLAQVVHQLLAKFNGKCDRGDLDYDKIIKHLLPVAERTIDFSKATYVKDGESITINGLSFNYAMDVLEATMLSGDLKTAIYYTMEVLSVITVSRDNDFAFDFFIKIMKFACTYISPILKDLVLSILHKIYRITDYSNIIHLTLAIVQIITTSPKSLFVTEIFKIFTEPETRKTLGLHIDGPVVLIDNEIVIPLNEVNIVDNYSFLLNCFKEKLRNCDYEAIIIFERLLNVDVNVEMREDINSGLFNVIRSFGHDIAHGNIFYLRFAVANILLSLKQKVSSSYFRDICDLETRWKESDNKILFSYRYEIPKFSGLVRPSHSIGDRASLETDKVYKDPRYYIENLDPDSYNEEFSQIYNDFF
jgi:hypothetical protein